MVRVDMARRLKVHRVLSAVLGLLTLAGWGALAYSTGTSASTARDLRAELAQLKASQDQLLAERKQQQEAVGDLTQLQSQITSARDELQALAQKREQAKVRAAAVQQDRTELTKWLEGKRAKVSEKGRARTAKVSSRHGRAAAAQAKDETW
jgi:chromosome segregation ATPase